MAEFRAIALVAAAHQIAPVDSAGSRRAFGSTLRRGCRNMRGDVVACCVPLPEAHPGPFLYVMAPSYLHDRTGWLGRVDSNLCISESEFAKTLGGGIRTSAYSPSGA